MSQQILYLGRRLQDKEAVLAYDTEYKTYCVFVGGIDLPLWVGEHQVNIIKRNFDALGKEPSEEYPPLPSFGDA